MLFNHVEYRCLEGVVLSWLEACGRGYQHRSCSTKCLDKMPTDKITNVLLLFCPFSYWPFCCHLVFCPSQFVVVFCPDHLNMIWNFFWIMMFIFIITTIIITRPKLAGWQGIAGRSLRAFGAQLGSGKWWFFVTQTLHHNIDIIFIFVQIFCRNVLYRKYFCNCHCLFCWGVT